MEEAGVTVFSVAVIDRVDAAWLYEIISIHFEATGSVVAAGLLEGWKQIQTRFARLGPVGTPALQMIPVHQRRRRSG